MRVINITEEQRDKLCNELAKLLFEFRKNENIECIYYRTFIWMLGFGKNVLDIVLVNKENIEEEDKECVRGYEHYTDEQCLKEFGVKIHVCMDNANLYTTIALNKDEIIRQNELFNSTILFDKTRKYSKIKENAKKAGITDNIYYYGDLAKIHPPIEKALDNVIDISNSFCQ